MKQHRTLTVMTVALLTAGLAAFGVYQAIQRMPLRQVEMQTVPVVVAARAVPVGTRLTKDDVKLAAWPARTQVVGAFSNVAAVVDRGVIAPIAMNEPVTTTRVAGPEAGAGLPPIIPAGMRAISVRVNEVVGVAGFVLPGTRVDVLVAVADDGDESNRKEPMARTVVSNVQVLTAGTRYDQDEAKNGKAQRSTVVTLAVLPEDGERIALASNEGQLSLVLRNPLDVDPADTKGIKLAALMKGTGAEPVLDAPKRKMVPAKKPAAAPAPPEPQIYKVEAIRGAKRTEEAVH
ncbi:MAG TPA: Flp pilus assembly protein CpaB [Vicinamibacterales bacterium]|jgi:pilus assembly protein CpaB|nr:Flp pilus assembly protein CpaB [Vicinamibacterales bacterium]